MIPSPGEQGAKSSQCDRGRRHSRGTVYRLFGHVGVAIYADRGHAGGGSRRRLTRFAFAPTKPMREVRGRRPASQSDNRREATARSRGHHAELGCRRLVARRPNFLGACAAAAQHVLDAARSVEEGHDFPSRRVDESDDNAGVNACGTKRRRKAARDCPHRCVSRELHWFRCAPLSHQFILSALPVRLRHGDLGAGGPDSR